ncbi:cilia- and flagella-associated protein 298 [Contarinia nasturtii]|uniref:cilia- and flagella-associated protein 298 n=1 Tax=Contarinia nasturtii TaxID=265458 RepID=UPI0012D37E12|nr:cilia- and flagella-associated protein 298 [Contarinia nasturtii]
MVFLHLKRGNESQFLFETSVTMPISKLNKEIVLMYNGRLKISRICSEMEGLKDHGPMFPPEIIGLTEEQVRELKLVDQYAEKVVPSDGWVYNRDPVGRRNGRQPNVKMQELLLKSINDAKEMVSKKMIDDNKSLTLKHVQNAIDILKGAVTIVYPMGLPPHDPIYMEFNNTEDLSGTQAALDVIEPSKMQLWFAGRQMLDEKLLSDYLGKNEKCKVIVKIVKHGEGAPGREPVFNEEVRKQIMLQQYRRQEELKRLEEDHDDSYLNSKWADNSNLKQQLHGIQNINFRFGSK